MGDYLNLVLQNKNERKKTVYFLLLIVLSTIISIKFYGRLFDDSYIIIDITDYKKIVSEFLLTERFILSLIIFIAIFKSFYDLIDFFLYRWLAIQADKLYDFFKNEFDITEEDVRVEIEKGGIFKKIIARTIKNLKAMSLIDYDKKENKTNVKPGLNFIRLLEYFRLLNNPKKKERIDTSIAFIPIPITIQIILLFDSVVIDHIELSYCLIILANIVGLVLIIVYLIIYFLNIFVDLKQDKILAFLEKLKEESD